MALKAFTGDITKMSLLQEIKKHRLADEIVKGTYGKRVGKKFEACAVGCSIHSINKLKKKRYSTSNHQVMEDELGIPAELAYLEDAIFENLPNYKALLWPERFTTAINEGADLSLVITKFVIWQFEDKKYGLKNIQEVKEDKEIYGFCKRVVALYKRKLKGDEPTEKEFYDLYIEIDRAGAGAEAGARAWARAWARARAGARAWARAWARARARAGAWAWAWAGAGAGAYEIMADKLVEILEDTK